MKLEKLNDNQIRCILDKSDLDERELHLSELAYGSTKARELFRDMIEKAANEFGFEVDNIPLMIEAIPVSMDCLILVVTKVEDPEELDTRFARFSSHLQDADMDDENFDLLDDDDMMLSGMDGVLAFGDLPELENELDADMETGIDISMETDGEKESTEEGNNTSDENPTLEEVFDLMAPFNQAIAKAKQELKKKHAAANSKPLSDQIYAFASFDDVVKACQEIVPFYYGDSALYKDPVEGVYYLALKRMDMNESIYRRACNICSDYGEAIVANYAALAYFEEHFQKILSNDAVVTLFELGA